MRKASSTRFDTRADDAAPTAKLGTKASTKLADKVGAKTAGKVTSKVALAKKLADRTAVPKTPGFAEKTASLKAKTPVVKKQLDIQSASTAESPDSPIDTTQIAKLLDFDRKMRRKWLLPNSDSLILGTDEVGRGCLAGPVVAAAVVLPEFTRRSPLARALSLLDDSKKLSPKVRADLAAILRENCVYAIGQATVEEIDKINILKASLLAMSRAIAQLKIPESSALLVDGNQRISDLSIKQILVVGGDGISASIAAASVIAKVYRDEMMAQLHKDFPHYAWHSNKGYGSKTHCQAIIEKGLSPFHRQSFCSRIMNEQLQIEIPE